MAERERKRRRPVMEKNLHNSWATQLGRKTQIHHVPAWSWAEWRSNCGAALGLFQAKPYGEGEQVRQLRQDQVQART